MLESIERPPYYGQCPTFTASSSISTFLNNCAEASLPLISPEDTTENAGNRRRQFTKFDGNPMHGVIKTVFWMAVAIGLALLIGQLH